MAISQISIHLPIAETDNLGLDEKNESKPSSNMDEYPINRKIISFREDNLEIDCCIGVFWNKELKQYFIQIFLKKFKLQNQKPLLTDSELFLKCSFSGFGIYYCAISKCHLTNFYIHRKFSNHDDFVDATFEVIPFLPFKLDLNFQLVPLLAIAHSTVIPPLQFYDTEWPFISYIRQILTSNDGSIMCPPLNSFKESYSIIFDVASINNKSDIKNIDIINQIFGVTESICEELGVKYQAVYGIPQNVYRNHPKVKLNPDTDFLIYALPPEFQSEIPTIISDDFADQNPYHLCSLIRKEIDNDYYFLTIYSPSLNTFYQVNENNIISIDSKPSCYKDEHIISALYIRLNILDLFRFHSLYPKFTPRYNLVKVYETDVIFYLDDFNNDFKDEDIKKSIPHEVGVERADDLDEEPGIALFPYDPNNLTFPSIPLTCTSSHSVLKLRIDPSKTKKFQIVWFCHCHKIYIPVVVNLTESNCIKAPPIKGEPNFAYDMIHISSNYLTTPYKEDEVLPTGPMLFFKVRKLQRHSMPISFAFGNYIGTSTLNQFTQPPAYTPSGRYELAKVLKEVKEARGIQKCNCFIRSYIQKTKIVWIKLSEQEAEINSYFNDKFPVFVKKHNFAQVFIELL